MSSIGTDFRGLSIISCCQCRKRKIKCDRHFPQCQNCNKKSYDCSYPPTLRKTSTKLTKKRKVGNVRYYGLSSVNRSLFEVGMPFCNVDFELESKNAPTQIKKFTSSAIFERYIKNPEATLRAIGSLKESFSSSFFAQLIDFDALELALQSRQGSDYQSLLLCYSIILASDRFTDNSSDLEELLKELNLILDKCPDCPEKVSSYILLADYYHYNFKIESAWKCNFLATSIAYALGLHTSSSKIWAMLVLNDALLCSVLGRPSSIKSIDTEVVCGLCDGWGEIASLLRECNEVLLNLTSSNSIEKIIGLDMKYDEFIEKTKKTMNLQNAADNPEFILLGYLKICIIIAIRIKLLFPVFPKYRAIKKQLDENCSALTHCLRGLFQFLTTSGLGSEKSPFTLRSQAFPAYCSMFQGFLLQFIFTSNELLAKPTEVKNSLDCTTPAGEDGRSTLVSSLANISTLIQDYEDISENISFCSFMTDVFDSFRALLIQKKRGMHGKRRSDPASEECSTNISVESSQRDLTGLDLGNSEFSLMTEDISDLITSCFSEGMGYFDQADP